jgi:hypothetical protein
MAQKAAQYESGAAKFKNRNILYHLLALFTIHYASQIAIQFENVVKYRFSARNVLKSNLSV